RHAHRLGDRRLLRPVHGGPANEGSSDDQGAAHPPVRGGGQLRGGRWGAGARPRLRRGLPRSHRPQLRDGRGRPHDRGPGHGREAAVQPGRAGGHARARAQRHPRADGSPEASARRLVVATRNPGKLAELRQLLAGAGVDLEEWGGEVEETGATYAENAALKAVAASTATGLPALGDDSGLEVEALGGEPGLHSRRLGPTQAARNAELWRRLAAVPRPWRARFVAVLALAR